MGYKPKSLLPNEPYENRDAFDQDLARATFTSFDIEAQNVSLVLDGLSLANIHFTGLDYSMGHHKSGAYIAVRLPHSVREIREAMVNNFEDIDSGQSDEEHFSVVARNNERQRFLNATQYKDAHDPINLAILGYELAAQKTDDPHKKRDYLEAARLLSEKRIDMLKYSLEKRSERILGIRPAILKLIRDRIAKLNLTDPTSEDSISE